jgi:hypothetical protein
MFEGDIVTYDLSAYGFDEIVTVKILEVLDGRIVVSPLAGEWAAQLQEWNWRPKETLSSDYIIDYIYTIAPKTPSREGCS